MRMYASAVTLMVQTSADALHVEVTTGVPSTHTSNPLCERRNRVVEQKRRILMKQQRIKGWVRLVPWAVLTMNSQRSSSTGVTPTCFFTEDDLLGSAKSRFLRTWRALLGIGWNTNSLWLTRLGQT